MDSQSVRMTQTRDVRDCDAGRKIKGRKRHAIVESDGQALKMQAHAADIQYRDGAGLAAAASRTSWLFVQLADPDAGY